MRAFNHTRPLAWAALMVGLMTAMGDATADASGSPGIFEVDALFPRNETYAPQALMPIVFAVQNPALASSLEAFINWDLWEGNNHTSPGSVPGGAFQLDTMDFPSNGTFLITRIVNTLAYPDGVWTLYWDVTINNCSQPEGQTQPITMNSTTLFTISRSGQTPDLVAATSADKCGTTDAYAFNATSFGDTCGVLGSSPTTNPCAATINPSAASSIYAEATAAACSPLYRQQNPNVTCPTPSTADAPGRSRMAAASTLLTVLATLTVLFHLG